MVRLCQDVGLRARVLAAIDADLMVAGSKGQRRAHPLLSTLTALEGSIAKLEDACGFTPRARSSLGASEVKRVSKLEEMMARRRAADRPA